MKYAFIVLIVLYLITYGCSPDTPEKAEESHEQAVETTAIDAHNGDKAAGAIEQVYQTPAAVVQDDALHSESANIESPAVIMQQPVVIEQKPAPVAESEQVVLPCGKTMSQADIATNAPPCMKMHAPETVGTGGATGTQRELEVALQKMVQTTNDMVLATRELVIAAQAILNADKKSAEQTPPGELAPEGHGAAPLQQ